MLVTSALYAQKGLKGYVVTSAGDTLHGMIKKSQFSDLRGTKFYGDNGRKIKIVSGEILAFKVDREVYRSVSVKDLGITDDVKNNGYMYIKLIVDGPVQLYKVGYCFGKKTINDRKNRVYKERCPDIYFFKKDSGDYFEAFRNEDLAMRKVNQKHTSAELAGYFQDAKELSKEIMYEMLKRHMVDVMAKRYNEWFLKETDK